MGAADDDELFRRPGAPPPPGPPPVPTRVPRYPQPVSRQPAPPPPAPSQSPSARTQRAREPAVEYVGDPLDDRARDQTDGEADELEGRRPWSWPVIAAVLVASVAGVLAGLVLLRPALEAGARTTEPTAGPSLRASPSGDPASATSEASAAPGPSEPSGPAGPASVTSTPSGLPGPVTDAPVLPPTPPASLTAIGEDASARQLRSLRDGDRARVRFTGQWVAQLAAKYSGVVDPLQTTTSGSHRFGAQDILAEHWVLRGRFGAGVVLLLGTDHSPRLSGPSGAPVWVTSYTGPFGSRQVVEDWCRRSFPGLEGAALADHCVARRFTP